MHESRSMETLRTNKLLTPIQVGSMQLKHRVVMAPLTRSRSLQPGSIPGDLMLEYYSQRASDGGLLVSEGTSIFDCRRRMVRGTRLVFGRAGCGMEENHKRSSREARAHVLPTVAYGACCACGLDERQHPCQLFSQPRVLEGSNDKNLYPSRLATAFASPGARNQRLYRGLSQSRRAC